MEDNTYLVTYTNEKDSFESTLTIVVGSGSAAPIVITKIPPFSMPQKRATIIPLRIRNLPLTTMKAPNGAPGEMPSLPIW